MFINQRPTLSVDISKLIIYYTDYHDVDEDKVSIASHSGHWDRNERVGMMFRNVQDSPNRYVNDVA